MLAHLPSRKYSVIPSCKITSSLFADIANHMRKFRTRGACQGCAISMLGSTLRVKIAPSCHPPSWRALAMRRIVTMQCIHYGTGTRNDIGMIFEFLWHIERICIAFCCASASELCYGWQSGAVFTRRVFPSMKTAQL